MTSGFSHGTLSAHGRSPSEPGTAGSIDPSVHHELAGFIPKPYSERELQGIFVDG